MVYLGYISSLAMLNKKPMFLFPYLLSSITYPYLPFSKLTDKIQLFHDYLQWKEFFIFKCFLSERGKNDREVAK